MCFVLNGCTSDLICGFQKQRVLKDSHDAAMLKVDELSAQLNDERMKSMGLEKQLQSSSIPRMTVEQVSCRTQRILHVSRTNWKCEGPF